MNKSVLQKVIEEKIFVVRGHKVMLSPHLAKLYGVSVKRLNEQVKRNIKRFPEDFMFQLSAEESSTLKLQIVTLNSRSQIATLKQGQNIKYYPYAFTEQGVAMLSSVLNSNRAIQVNITVMRAFVKLREILSTHKELVYKLKELEGKIAKHDMEIQSIFEAIRRLMASPPDKKRVIIGFKPLK
jgi:phage regulator Rha-like protein